MENTITYKLNFIPSFFTDRSDAGKRLARLLGKYKNEKCVIYALPRGGIVIGKEIADKLECFLNIIAIKKISHPDNPEYAIGAVSEDGHAIYNQNELEFLDKDWLEEESKRGQEEAKRRRKVYVGEPVYFNLKDKTAIIVDDGIATGLDMLLAIKEIRHKNPKKIVVAVPVASIDSSILIGKEVDEFISILSPRLLGSVSAYYENFNPVSDEEVIEIIENNASNLYQKSRLY
jgi:putative phosphoribosyl transferase